MSPTMFHYDRSYMTRDQMSLSIKTIEATKNPLTCAMKYSQYAQNLQGIHGSRIAPNNCTKTCSVYDSHGKLIGRKFFVLNFT